MKHTVNLLIVLSCSGFEFVAGISSHFPKTFLDHFVGNVHTDIHDSSVILLRLQANVHVYSVSCCAFAFEQHSWLGKPAKFPAQPSLCNTADAWPESSFWLRVRCVAHERSAMLQSCLSDTAGAQQESSFLLCVRCVAGVVA